MSEPQLTPPAGGEKITIADGVLQVPDKPIVPFIEGDGIGPDIWRAASRVLDTSVHKAYGGQKEIQWHRFAPAFSDGDAAVDDEGLSGRIGALVRGQVDGHGRDFLGRAEAPHRLARDEVLARLLGIVEGADPLVERWRLHGARTDGVAAHTLGDEIGRNRFGEPEHGCLGGAVDEAIG